MIVYFIGEVQSKFSQREGGSTPRCITTNSHVILERAMAAAGTVIRFFYDGRCICIPRFGKMTEARCILRNYRAGTKPEAVERAGLLVGEGHYRYFLTLW
jgi:hypothetical protein